MGKYNKLLEDNIICKELEKNEEYKKETVQADILFYLLKENVSREGLKLLMKYDEIITSMHTKEKKKWFEEGTKLGLK